MKPVIIGIANPYDSTPLDPRVIGSAGRRLWKMTGMPLYEYCNKFTLANVEDGPVPSPSGVIIVLGDEARRALKLRRIFFHPQVCDGRTYRCVPHPSGVNLFYNDPICRRLVRMLLKEVS